MIKYNRHWYETRKEALNERRPNEAIYFDTGMRAYYTIPEKESTFWGNTIIEEKEPSVLWAVVGLLVIASIIFMNGWLWGVYSCS